MLSAILSVLSIVLGQLQWMIIQKSDFMPMKGKFFISAFTLVSVLVRTLSCIIFFAPSLGLGNLLMHWKMGALEAAKTSTIHDDQKELVHSLVYDVLSNGTFVYFTKVWRRVESYEELTLLSLGSYTKIFLSFLVLHFVLIFGIKTAFSRKFRYIINYNYRVCHKFRPT